MFGKGVAVMKNSFLEKYLHDLNKELSILPNKEKMHYMEEMKDHLFSLIEEKKGNGNARARCNQACPQGVP